MSIKIQKLKDDLYDFAEDAFSSVLGVSIGISAATMYGFEMFKKTQSIAYATGVTIASFLVYSQVGQKIESLTDFIWDM